MFQFYLSSIKRAFIKLTRPDRSLFQFYLSSIKSWKSDAIRIKIIVVSILP